MTPEERSLLSDLFRRLREVESQPRDVEAEDFIRRAVQDQPESAYYMAQTVLVQQQALTAAQTRIEQLERQLRDRPAQPAASGGSFLSNVLGRSPWSRGAEQPPAPPPAAGRSPWGGGPGAAYPRQPYAPQPSPQAGMAPGMAPRGGGFFAGAAQTAAGVAGGMLAASAISSLLHHSPGPIGEAAAQTPVSETINETVIDNDYGGDPGAQPDAVQDASYDPAPPPADDATYDPGPPPADDGSFDDSPFDDGGNDDGGDSWI